MTGPTPSPPRRPLWPLGALAALGLASGAAAQDEVTHRQCSPDGALCFELGTDETVPVYRVLRDGEEVIASSQLGFMLRGAGKWQRGIVLGEASRSSHDETWEQPWGESRLVTDRHNAMRVPMTEQGKTRRTITLAVRVFDNGIGFRYEFPAQPQIDPQLDDVIIDEELTEFTIAGDAEAWWIPGGEWNRYEYLYARTPAREVGTAHTPITFRRADGLHIALHEAALTDYAAYWLQRIDAQRFRTRLAPSSQPWKVRRDAPFATPWRVILIAPDAPGLYAAADIVLNLNEPNRLGEVPYARPQKYVGIWWAMHLDLWSWNAGPKHGATTQHAIDYIDFAAEHGFDSVLIEGWNEGWWSESGRNFQFATAYPDFDMDRVAAYAAERGIEIMGHHETAGNAGLYERQLEEALDYYQRHGVHAVKTGYVADAGVVLREDPDGTEQWEYHDGQFMARHHALVAERAAAHEIAINAHEPIKDTGLRRTWPNLMTREGARGTEYMAWGEPRNPPDHEPTLLFTRMLSGPFDLTPGIVSLEGRGGELLPNTLARQLADYVVIYSPLQMAADLPENYLAAPDALDFIEQVPVDWERTKVLSGEIGQYAVVARQRRGGDDWWICGVNDDDARTVDIDLSFLDPGTRYTIEIWRDGEGGGINGDRFAMVRETREIRGGDRLAIEMLAGGGFAMSLRPRR
ncbi:glycoside hydrolase family 97 protein [Alteriqipengyuania lutimaris]|uniref:Glycoside hydrolase family 97 protein n=1 Tax=Alteriqipengyuania lutimaris TaxID=1538146 RepID=A0A395LPU8_9SPHN|nr:glycoside hydrolase family 97 protein [Alteriqipengyuania lutimaris]MBB3034871.1 alpha-glucosidase [Alteriqipengyuania lutimaris]RDS78467.1 glycoside hydrolase family 97 protein [Alteriqipengyuania lutimaris]